MFYEKKKSITKFDVWISWFKNMSIIIFISHKSERKKYGKCRPWPKREQKLHLYFYMILPYNFTNKNTWYMFGAADEAKTQSVTVEEIGWVYWSAWKRRKLTQDNSLKKSSKAPYVRLESPRCDLGLELGERVPLADGLAWANLFLVLSFLGLIAMELSCQALIALGGGQRVLRGAIEWKVVLRGPIEWKRHWWEGDVCFYLHV